MAWEQIPTCLAFCSCPQSSTLDDEINFLILENYTTRERSGMNQTKKKAETSRDGHSNYLRNRRKETLKAKLNIIVCDSKLIFIIIDDSPDPTEYLYKLFIRFPLIFILLSWCSLFDRFMSFTINLLKIAPPETARESRPRWSEFIQETTLRTNV